MAPFKIAVLGAGSYVFGPSMLSQAFQENQIGAFELALVDVDPVMLDLMAGLGRRLIRDTGSPARVTTHTDRAAALDGADYVICAAAVEGRKRYQMDAAVIQQIMPGHLVTEFGGVAGISYSLRQIALITAITADMQRWCPDAWLLNVANPLPRVCQAAHASGIMTVGFCSVALAAYSALWQLLLDRPPLTYPFTDAIKAWHMTTAGVNHFTWMLELSDRQTGADLRPQIVDRLRAGATSGNPQSEAICLETGYFLAAGDSHVRDFLKPRHPLSEAHVPFHGSESERWQRMQHMREVTAGERAWDDVFRQVSWERPLDLIAARATGSAAEFRALNLINQGQMPDLPEQVFVETPCTVTPAGELQPQTLRLPESVRSLTQHTARVTDTIVQAALRRDHHLLDQAVELDPTIEDKAAGIRALDACIQAHADLLPVYG